MKSPLNLLRLPIFGLKTVLQEVGIEAPVSVTEISLSPYRLLEADVPDAVLGDLYILSQESS